MREKSRPIPYRLKTVLFCISILLTLATVTPVLADYLGPDRTVTQTGGSCKVVLYKCGFVPAKGIYKYKSSNTWSCSNESKPWLAYPSSGPACTKSNVGATYWKKVDDSQEETITYPPATIEGFLQNCSPNNGWCTTFPQFSLSADEPLPNYDITAIEGTWNGQNFACPESDCSVPLTEGNNALTYWALSSWGDSSTMGSLTVKVDSQQPVISGAFSGTTGSNGWYLGPVSFTGSAADTTSGLASFTCTLDGAALASCTSIDVSDEGPHTLVLTALDNAGNSSMVVQDTSIDSRPPALNSSLQGSLGSNSWYNDAELHVSASDPIPGSGLFALEYSVDGTAWITFPLSGVLDLPDGKHSVDVRVADGAGHSVASSKSYWLDSLAPDVILDPQGTLGANGWYVTNLNLSASASDDTSGLDIFEYTRNGSTWTTYTSPLVLGDGSHAVSFWAQDTAGLVTQVDQLYQVDTVRPQIAGTLSGIPGTNGWYTSDVILSAASSDPLPGSGVDAFTYILDGGIETPYASALTIPDGVHIIRLNVQDKAGLTYFTEQSVKVDTIHPFLSIQTTLPAWVNGKVTLNGASEDGGSGISKIEISTNGGQTWRTATGTTSWSYEWDTSGDSNGSHTVIVRATDQAGLTSQQTVSTAVDNQAPNIQLRSHWLSWQVALLDIWDTESGIAEARLEIIDPERRWPRRLIQLASEEFPMHFKWDRRFGDETIAPNGDYVALVTAIDQLGNVSQQYSSVSVVIDVLPAGPTSTPPPYYRVDPAPILLSTPIPVVSPAATAMAVVSVFGEIQPTAEGTQTPEAALIPRPTPTQTGIVEWLESVLIPRPDLTYQTTKLDTLTAQTTNSSVPGTRSNILWGAAAAAMVGAVTSYALEEKRKREESLAAKRAEEAALEERKSRIKVRKMEKLEDKWAQEREWEVARLTEQAKDARIKAKLTQREIEDTIAWTTLQNALQKKAEAQRHFDKLTRVEEQHVRLDTYVERPLEQVTLTKPTEKSWWQKSIDWIDDHQTEIALGIGVVIGVTAIVLSGGTATPLVAAAWIAGAAFIAGGTAALGTVALNRYYERDWNENLLGNVLAAGVVAAMLTGAGFLYQAVAGGATTFCTINTNLCTRAEPILKFVDSIEEVSLATQLGYQTLTHDPGAADTALELHMELVDGGMPGNAIGKELSTEVAENLTKHGDEAIELVKLYGDDAIQIILKYEDEGIALLQKYGDEITSSTAKYGDDAVELFARYDDDAIDFIKRAEKLEIDPTKILSKPPSPGQSLEGWLLGVEDPANPVNMHLKFKLSEAEITELRRQSIQNPDSPLFSIGYGRDAEIPFGEMANKFDNYPMSFLDMPASEWKKYEDAGAYGDFWEINSDAIEWAMEERKIFVLNVNYELATRSTDPNATRRFTYAELKLIDKIDDGYTLVPYGKYSFLVPDEHLDDFEDFVPVELLMQ